MAKPLPVGTLRFLCLGLHSEFGIAESPYIYTEATPFFVTIGGC